MACTIVIFPYHNQNADKDIFPEKNNSLQQQNVSWKSVYIFSYLKKE